MGAGEQEDGGGDEVGKALCGHAWMWGLYQIGWLIYSPGWMLRAFILR